MRPRAGIETLAVDAAAEQRLRTILDTVDAAITVRDLHGRMVFANQAAAEVLKLPGPEDVAAAAPAELMERFEVYDELGDPVALGDLPGTRIFTGEIDPPPLVVRNIVRSTGEERWLLNRVTAVRDDEGRPILAINVIDDITDTKRAEIGQRLLARAGRALAGARDLEQTLQTVAELAVPGLADWAAVELGDPRTALRTVALAHRDPAKVRLGWRVRTTWPAERGADGVLAMVVRTGRSRLIEEIDDAMLVAGARDGDHLDALRSVGLRSAMIVPMRAGDRIVGALSFASSTARRFDERDLQLAEDVGRLAGTAIVRAQLASEQAEIAHTLQASLLPDSLPSIPGWELRVLYRPAGLATEAGGDFYDAVRWPGGWALLLGDVTGKGARAAALTGMARHTLRTAIELTGDPRRALAALNQALRRRGDDLDLCSVVVAVLHDGSGELEVLTAGHPLPLLRTRAGTERLGRTGPLLGALDEVDHQPTHRALAAGDRLLLFTDGVIDAVGESGRFGEDGLEAVVRAAGDDLAAAVGAALDGFLQGPQPDDIAVLELARAGAPQAPAAGHDRGPWRWEAPAEPASVPVLRRRAVAATEALLDADAAASLALLVTEVVTNAVKHSGSTRAVELEMHAAHDHLSVAVADGGPGLAPNPGAIGAGVAGAGYGLFLVERSARRWGVTRQDGRTRVWFELALGRDGAGPPDPALSRR